MKELEWKAIKKLSGDKLKIYIAAKKLMSYIDEITPNDISETLEMDIERVNTIYKKLKNQKYL